MYQNSYENNLEAEVLSAEPVRLVALLVRGALDAIRAARVFLAAGDIRARSAQITKAQTILNELAISLDREQGGEIARNLAELYDYLQRRLIDGNFRQADQPLAEAENLLGVLAEAWDGCLPRPESFEPVAAFAMESSGDSTQRYEFVG